MPLPTLHLIAPFHTRLDDAHSHCAFSGKARRFPKMMKPFGYPTILYGNEGSQSEADETVVLLTNAEFDSFYPKQKTGDFHGSYAVIGKRGWPAFNARLVSALLERVEPGDLICHPFGRAHEQLVAIFPNVSHVETGIGYGDQNFGCWRIFESECWRHYHFALADSNPERQKDRGNSRPYSWVVPNYFDLDEWSIGNGSGDYALFMGRICPEKGMSTLVEIIKADAGKTEFVFAGQGDFEGLVGAQIPKTSRVRFLGPVTGRARAELVGKARCALLSSTFIEPFGGAVVEAMLTGTPAVTVNFGAPTETVNHGVTGYRCNTLADWLAAIDASGHLNRNVVSAIARAHYSLEACGKLYDAAFRQLADLNGKGWYTPTSYRIT